MSYIADAHAAHFDALLYYSTAEGGLVLACSCGWSVLCPERVGQDDRQEILELHREGRYVPWR